MSRLRTLAAGQGLFARALRGSMLTAGSYAVSQGLRLASNLILTRLLYPEAFGMMALVNVVLIGLAMFSDMGVGPSIAQNPRGDEPAFLDTAFTINLARGVLLWGMTCLLAWPVSVLYGAPELATMLPVAGLALLASGFNPTRIDTAQRHLQLGRVTQLDLAAQTLGIAVMVGLALVWPSVWALVVGSVLGAVARPLVMARFLPGRRNRLHWEPEAGRALIRFGKWIFLSTACGFVISQGDKAILGGHLPLEAFGIYNIGYFLASFPMLLGGAVVSRIMIPIYRDRHLSPHSDARLRRLRFGLTGAILGMLAVMAAFGPQIVGLLYDPRYAGAGAVLVAVALVQMPLVVGMTYDQAALAAGRSRAFFAVIALRAVVQTAAFAVGVGLGGLGGALVAVALAGVLLHAAIVALARRFGVWDPKHDVVYAVLICVLATGVAGLQSEALASLLP